jgi:hypothetical protein
MFTFIFFIIAIPFHSVGGITSSQIQDFDPLVDIMVTFELLQIRSLEKHDNHLLSREYIDRFSSPDFYVKVWINDELFQSNIWRNTKYVPSSLWSATLDVPDDEELVDIKIQLWDRNIGRDKLCDISMDERGIRDRYDVELTYSIKYGCWWGDDYTNPTPLYSDPSGYGRLNGCDDGSIYYHERDCELSFMISQTDGDEDGIPYWMEVYYYGTDPYVDNKNDDIDNDGVSFAWEHHWGQYIEVKEEDGTFEYHRVYDPLNYDPHVSYDNDQDGLNNVEEYKTSAWYSDPFRRDLFVEMDIMDNGPNGEQVSFPESSKQLLQTVFNRRNIVFHLDDGALGGGEIIPFERISTHDVIKGYYQDYFLHNDPNNWRKGVFHYGLVIYEALGGYGFVIQRDAYQISVVGMEKQVRQPHKSSSIVYASAYMHECGHTLGIFHSNTPGCDDQLGKYPWQLNWWKWYPYKSVMNYGHMYLIVDYSDGSRKINDFDDWSRLDFTFFQG